MPLKPATAQRHLARRLANGRGVEKNTEEALKWAILASVKGIKNARKLEDKLRTELTPEQIATAEAAVKDFTPVKSN